MKTHLAQRSIAAAAAAAVTFALISAVVAIGDHEKEKAVFLAAQIKPQALASSSVDTKAR